MNVDIWTLPGVLQLLSEIWASGPRFEGGSYLTFPLPSFLVPLNLLTQFVPWNLFLWPSLRFKLYVQLISVKGSVQSLKGNLVLALT